MRRRQPRPHEAIGGTPFIVINRDAFIRFRYRYIPDHVVGELLAKRWMDNAIPFLALIVVLVVFGRILPGFYSISNLTDLSRQFAELLQSKGKAGERKVFYYGPLTKITKETISPRNCWTMEDLK